MILKKQFSEDTSVEISRTTVGHILIILTDDYSSIYLTEEEFMTLGALIIHFKELEKK